MNFDGLFSLTMPQVILLLAGGLVTVYAVLVTLILRQRRRFDGDISARDLQNRRLIHALKEGVMVTDELGRFVDVNENLSLITGYSPRELAHLTIADLFPGDGAKNRLNYKLFHQQMRKRKHHREKIEEIRRKDGRITSHEVHYFYMNDDTLLSLVHEDEDLSKETRTTQYSEQHMRQMLDLSLDMIVAVDKQRRITEFNRAAEKAFGYQREEVMGKHVSILYVDENQGRKAHGATFAEVDYQYILNKRKNGDVFPSLLASRVLYGAGSEIVGLVGYSREVKTEGSAADAKNTLTISARPAEYFFKSTDRGVLREASESLVRVLGYSSVGELLSISETDTLYVHPDDRKKFQLQSQTKAEPVKFDVSWRKRSGEALLFVITAHAVRDDEGAFVIVEGFARPAASTTPESMLYLHHHNPSS